jgi:hypothetical protein
VNTFPAPKIDRALVILILLLGLSGCSVLPPTQELSDARQMLKAAQSQSHHAQATTFYVWMAENHLLSAQQELEKGHHAYSYARFHALEAYRAALRAHQLARAFDRAEYALAEAARVGYLWRDSEALLEAAQQAALGAHFDQALALAQQAQSQGEAAQRQAQYEQVRYQLLREHLPERPAFTPEQLEMLRKYRQPDHSPNIWDKP